MPTLADYNAIRNLCDTVEARADLLLQALGDPCASRQAGHMLEGAARTLVSLCHGEGLRVVDPDGGERECDVGWLYIGPDVLAGATRLRDAVAAYAAADSGNRAGVSDARCFGAAAKCCVAALRATLPVLPESGLEIEFEDGTTQVLGLMPDQPLLAGGVVRAFTAAGAVVAMAFDGETWQAEPDDQVAAPTAGKAA